MWSLEEMHNLQNLNNVDHHLNHLTGPIVAVFSIKSGNLEMVDLSRNKCRGSIPLKVGDRNYMQQLVVSHNSLSGAIPS